MKIHLSLGQICATNYLSNLNLWAPDVAKTRARQRQIRAGWRSPAHKYSRGLNHLFLDPVREVAQCDFESRMHLYGQLIVKIQQRIGRISSVVSSKAEPSDKQHYIVLMVASSNSSSLRSPPPSSFLPLVEARQVVREVMLFNLCVSYV